MVEEAVWKRISKVKLLPENNRRLRYLSSEDCQRLVGVCNHYLKPIVIMALNGRLVEFSETKKLFTAPMNRETEDYITGRFG